MADEKSARIVWAGEELNFQATLGTGYSFNMSRPSPQGGSPMEYMLAGAAGCTAMDVISILQKRRQQVEHFEVAISGIQADDHPHVYTQATITYIIRGHNIRPDAVEKAIELSQTKYCSASIMLRRAGVELHTDYRIEEIAPAVGD